MKLLILIQDLSKGQTLARGFLNTAHRVDLATSLEEALATGSESHYDLLVMWIENLVANIKALVAFLARYGCPRKSAIIIVNRSMIGLTARASELLGAEVWPIAELPFDRLLGALDAYQSSLPTDAPAPVPPPEVPTSQPITTPAPPAGVPSRLGFWSPAGAGGATTLALFTASVRRCPLVDLCPPGATIAGAATGVQIVRESEDIASQTARVLDLPSGRAGLPSFQLTDAVCVVLPAERYALGMLVALLANTTNTVARPPLYLVWNRVAPASGVSDLNLIRPTSPIVVGAIGDFKALVHARERQQSADEANKDGLSLGRFIEQASVVIRTLYREVDSQPPVVTSRRSWIPKVSVIND